VTADRHVFVLKLISEVEPGLDLAVVTGVVTAVAPRRNVRRRLARALCAGCGKQLRTMQRRGQDWCCGVSARESLQARPAEASARSIRATGRDGHADATPAHPTTGPTRCSATAGTGAVNAVTPRAGQRRHRAWALQDRPELLTGADAQSPVPSVLRLIDALANKGAGRIVRPPCPRCGRCHHAEQDPR
jgi:hypothetical protein